MTTETIAKNYSAIKERASIIYKRSPLWLMLRPKRRFQAYCIGTAKSGTHSLAGLFKKQYRTNHESESHLVIEKILDYANGVITQDEMRKFVRQRDQRIWLEMDSSQINYFLLDNLLEQCDSSKFILTIRDCYSWIDSLINHQLARGVTDEWLKLRDFRFKSDKFKHTKAEKILAEHGLYTLDGYLSYWTKHNTEVLAKVPNDRLIVVRTHEIEQELKRIANFLGVPVETLNAIKSHSFKAKQKFGILWKIDRQFLEDKINFHCRNLMDKYFPEFQSLEDSLK